MGYSSCNTHGKQSVNSD